MPQALTRRRFLKSAAASSTIAIPYFIPGHVLGRDGAVAPSNRLTLGGIGVGNRGSYVLSRFLQNTDVQMVATADLQRTRREANVLPNLPGWNELTAACRDQVYAVDGNAYFNRSGPRIIDSLEILAHLLHPQEPATRVESTQQAASWCRLDFD